MKRILFFTMCLALLCACTDGPLVHTIPVTGVTIDQDDVRVFLDHELTLAATVSPADATNKNLIWESSDKSVVTVSDGVVKAVGLGTATVTVKTEDGGFSAECIVRVVEECQTQTKGPVTLNLGNVTATTAVLSGFLDVDKLADYDMSSGGVGFIYAPVGTELNIDKAKKVQISNVDSENGFTYTLTELSYDTEYQYTIFLFKNSICQYGELQMFKTTDVTISVEDVVVTNTTATLSGMVVRDEADAEIEVGVMYSSDNSFPSNYTTQSFKITPLDDGSYSLSLDGLKVGNEYYYRTYVFQYGAYEYGETKDFRTQDVSVDISVDDIALTTATFAGEVVLLDANVLEVGLLYSQLSDPKVATSGVNMIVLTDLMDMEGKFSYKAEGLRHGSTYYLRHYVKQGSTYTYGEVVTFQTEKAPITIDVEKIDKNVVIFSGNVQFSEAETIEIGIEYLQLYNHHSKTKISANEISKYGDFTIEISGLQWDTEYYWRYYLSQNWVTVFGEYQTFKITHIYNVQSDLNISSATDLSSSEPANCYIVSQAGLYKFKTVKGNSSTSVGNVASASILWESFGTSVSPEFCDLISGFCYKDGYIAFQTADTFKEGNAVIAAKDSDDNILWSWHIWFTDQPQAHVYNNSAGTMMDRNLGATSATKGDVGALGLLYQWGRKDPFLGSSSISSSTLAKSTITWPSAVESGPATGNVDYVISNPTTFVTASSSSKYDWHYASRDNTLWTTSDKTKSIYDPCPSGWRVPDGGGSGIWSKALGSSSSFTQSSLYDSTNEGMNFSCKFGSDQTIWYPASGCLGNYDGSLNFVGSSGYCWSAYPNSSYAYCLYFRNNGSVDPLINSYRAYGYSVRCLQE